MTILIPAILLCGCAVPAGTSQPATAATPLNLAERRSVSFDVLERSFAQPDMAYAPFTFWFWDAPLDPALTAGMAEEMGRQRLNPGYAHARNGLPHEQWLGKPWFEAFDAALKKAEAAGAYLGYCDEYWWPSGQADGRVLAAHPELAAVSLRWETRDVPGGQEVTLPESFFTVAAQHAELSAQARPAPKLGKWIWHPDAQAPNRTAYFRRQVTIDRSRQIASVRMTVTADNRYVLYENGQRLGEGNNWMRLYDYDLAPLLLPGGNVIAIEAVNEAGPCGLIAGLRIDYGDGTVEEIGADDRWRTATEAKADWTAAGFDETGWVAAAVIGNADAAPWNLSSLPAPIKIKGDTLKIVGAGKAFPWQAPTGTWRVYSFNKYHHAGIDGGKVNYLDRRLPKVFLDIAHEPYAATFGPRMGRSIPGVFVDNEGDYGWKLAWSEDLDREYARSKGRDIRLWMPLLIDEDVEGLWAKARWDWYDVVSQLYTDNYLGSVSRWLAERGLYCISNLWEETLALQVIAVGDFFKAQRAVTMPGNDCLVKKALEVHDFKETQSVTEFEGRRFMSEVLGVAGWQMSPVLMKQAANAAVAWGVSHVVPHGIYVNRKLNTIPYPPDWFTSNPYWRYLHLWTDFVRRASYVNSQGHLVPDVLLVSPMDSVQALLGDGVFDASREGEDPGFSSHADTIAHINEVYSKAITDLAAERIEYLIADRHYLREMTVTPGGPLKRGPFEFKTVVLPAMKVLPLEVAEKLIAFAEAGGRVYMLGELPEGSSDNGLNDPKMKDLMARLSALPSVRKDGRSIPQLVAENAPGLRPQAVFESGRFPMIQLHRRIDGRNFFWLVNNTGDRQECELTFRDAKGAASIWDCETGAIRDVPSAATEANSRVKLTFAPYEAYWLVFDSRKLPVSVEPAAPAWQVVAEMNGAWNVRIDPDVQPPPVGAPAALPFQDGGQHPLESWLKGGLDRFSGFVDYTATFDANADGGRCLLDLGQVKHTAEVWVNDQPVGCRLWPPFEFDVSKAVRKGPNTVRIRVGNLLCNAMRQHVDEKNPGAVWGWVGPKDEDFDAGLFGPVVVKQSR